MWHTIINVCFQNWWLGIISVIVFLLIWLFSGALAIRLATSMVVTTVPRESKKYYILILLGLLSLIMILVFIIFAFGQYIIFCLWHYLWDKLLNVAKPDPEK